MQSANAVSVRLEILERVKKLTNTQQFSTWFRNLDVQEVSGERVVFTVRSDFHRHWIISYYKNVLENAVQDVTGNVIPVSLKVTSHPTNAEPTTASENGANVGLDNGKEAVLSPLPSRQNIIEGAVIPEAVTSDRIGSPLIDGMDFSHFVIGPCNQLAQAAGIALSRDQQTDFSSMLVLGSVGLGKTHLLQSIARAATEQGRERVAYIRSETFLNDFVQAVAEQKTSQFRQRYRNLDFVCFDDLQTLSGKTQSQQELLHTVNSWSDRGARFVFAAAVDSISSLDLDPQLLSQLGSALRVNLQVPDPMTRQNLVSRKAADRGDVVPEDVIAYLSDLPFTSVRELEGAVTRLIAACRLTETPVTLRFAQTLLHEDTLVHRPSTSPDRIIRTVCQHFEVKTADLSSRRRPQALSFARHVVMYLLRERTELSLSEIGTLLGGRDHTTVLHGIRKIRKESEEDSRLRDHLSKIRTSLGS